VPGLELVENCQDSPIGPTLTTTLKDQRLILMSEEFTSTSSDQTRALDERSK